MTKTVLTEDDVAVVVTVSVAEVDGAKAVDETVELVE